jgi:hypothetical protein
MKNRIVVFGLLITLSLMSIGGNLVFAEETTVEEAETVSEELLSEEEATEDEVLELSLQEAIDYALENSKDMEIERLELLKAEVIYKDNIRAVEDLEDNPSSIRLREPGIISDIGPAIPDATVNRALVKNGAMRLSIELGYNVAKWNVEMKENQVKYNIEKAYFDILQVEKELEISEENLSLAKKQHEHGKLRYELGMISQQQLLALEFNLSQAQSGYDSANMYYELQRMSFKNTIGMPLDREFGLTGSIEYMEYEPIDLEKSIKSALENNGGILISKDNYEYSRLRLEAISARYPDITFRYREQAAEVAKADKNLETALVGAEMQVRSAVLNLTTAEKQIATFEKAVYQASEGVRIAELSFELGQSIPTEVAQANLNLMNAKKNLAQQIHAFNMALLDYKYSIGIGKGF